MIFQKQSISILLACIASSSAFTSASFSRKISATTFVPPSVIAAPFYSKINNALFSDEQESSEPVTEESSEFVAEVEATDSEAVVEESAVAEVADASEVISAEADESSEEATPAASAKKEEDDINCVAYVVNLSYGKSQYF
jgi:hypothetical protein